MKLVAPFCTKQLAAVMLCCTLGQALSSSPVRAATASGPSALALAAVVVAHSGSLLGAFEKRAISRLFEGKRLIIKRVNKIMFAVESIACKMSDVDITARSCELAFKNHKRNLVGRDANELYGTLALAGVTSEGAAGSIVASIMKLECTIDPVLIGQTTGRGATSTFEIGH